MFYFFFTISHFRYYFNISHVLIEYRIIVPTKLECMEPFSPEHFLFFLFLLSFTNDVPLIVESRKQTNSRKEIFPPRKKKEKNGNETSLIDTLSTRLLSPGQKTNGVVIILPWKSFAVSSSSVLNLPPFSRDLLQSSFPPPVFLPSFFFFLFFFFQLAGSVHHVFYMDESSTKDEKHRATSHGNRMYLPFLRACINLPLGYSFFPSLDWSNIFSPTFARKYW